MDDLENQIMFAVDETLNLGLNSQDFNPEELMKLVGSQSSDDLPFEDETPTSAAHLHCEPNLLPVERGFNFDVTLNGDSNNWLYVANPGKIFIKMNAAMTINASYSYRQHYSPMFLRAMILFDNVNEMHKPVKRCANHSASTVGASSNDSDEKHILKCLNTYAQYQGVEDGRIFKDRLSVVVPLDNNNIDEAGNCTSTIGYEFLCQNSCTSGINRKSTSIVFTLEDKNYQLLGKKAVQFKVCSCPKRDAEREYANMKRKAPGEPYAKGKRPKHTMSNSADLRVDVKIEPDDSDSSATPDDSMMPKCVEATFKLPVDIMRIMCRIANGELASKIQTDKNNNNQEWYQKLARDVRRIKNRLDDE